MKYIDAECLRKELDKRLKNVRDYMNGEGMKYKGPKYHKAQGKESAYDALLSIVDSLQQEQPDVDIREEIKKLEFMGSNDARDIEAVAKHFYELGLKSK